MSISIPGEDHRFYTGAQQGLRKGLQAYYTLAVMAKIMCDPYALETAGLEHDAPKKPSSRRRVLQLEVRLHAMMRKFGAPRGNVLRVGPGLHNSITPHP